jgi:hypothetical protein
MILEDPRRESAGDFSFPSRANSFVLASGWIRFDGVRGPIAQRLEQATHNRLVLGSNPSGPTTSQNPLLTGLPNTLTRRIHSDHALATFEVLEEILRVTEPRSLPFCSLTKWQWGEGTACGCFNVSHRLKCVRNRSCIRNSKLSCFHLPRTATEFAPCESALGFGTEPETISSSSVGSFRSQNWMEVQRNDLKSNVLQKPHNVMRRSSRRGKSASYRYSPKSHSGKLVSYAHAGVFRRPK